MKKALMNILLMIALFTAPVNVEAGWNRSKCCKRTSQKCSIAKRCACVVLGLLALIILSEYHDSGTGASSVQLS